MPKEITHWILAGRVHKDLSQHSLFCLPVKQFPNIFLMGSVAPDTPFMRVAGKKARQIQALSNPLHATGNTSLLPVIWFLKQFPKKDPAALAFAAGVICHILTDTCFHPMIGYYSGLEGVHPGARARHRLFETAMDYHFINSCTEEPPKSLFQIIRSLEIPKKKAVEFLAILLGAHGQGLETDMTSALLSHTALQYLFRARWAYRLFHFLHVNRLGIPLNVDTLFYPYKQCVEIGFFNKRLEFRDPESGETYKSRMDELASSAVEATLAVLEIIHATLEAAQDPERVLNHPDMPCIRPGYSKKEFQYWQERDNLDTQIYGSITRIQKQVCF